MSISGLVKDQFSAAHSQLYHMEADLHLTDTQYLICLTVFFFSYAIFEVRRIELQPLLSDQTTSLQVPSNVFLKRLRPSVWLSFSMLCWGIMMVSVNNLTNAYFSILRAYIFRLCRDWCTTTEVCLVSVFPNLPECFP